MDSSTTATASTDQAQLEKQQFHPEATVLHAVGAPCDENEGYDEQEQNGADEQDGGGEPADGCGDGGGVVELALGRVSPPLPVAADGGEWHSHCELAEQQQPATEAATEQEASEELMFITALAPIEDGKGVDGAAAAAEAATAEINQVAENHNTLATIVSDHGATTINGAQQQQQQQQIVYIHGASTGEAVESSTVAPVTTASPSTLVHSGTSYPNSNVVRIQIIPVEQCEQPTQPSPLGSGPLEDCNNNSVRGVGTSVSVVGTPSNTSPKCQSTQVTVVSFGACDSVASSAPVDSADQASAAHDTVLVTVTIEDRTLVSVPSTVVPDPTDTSTDAADPPHDPDQHAMVQKKLLGATTGATGPDATDLDSTTYAYYMAAMTVRDGPRHSSSSASGGSSSGQCSPSDMLDSGTCSDIELTPPPLPKKMSQMLKASCAIKKSLGTELGIRQPVTRTVTTTPPPPTVPAVTGGTVVRQFAPADNATDSVISQPNHNQHQHHIELQRLAVQQHEEARNRQNEHGKHQTPTDLTSDSFVARQQERQPPQHGSIIATDSDGSESCLSCDSLNFEHLPCLQPLVALSGNVLPPATVQRDSPTELVHGAGDLQTEQQPEQQQQPRPKLPSYLASKRDGAGVCILPDSLLAAIRGSRPKVYCTDEDDDSESVDGDAHRKHYAPATAQHDAPGTLDLSSLASSAAAIHSSTTRSILMDKINSLESGNRMQRATDQTEPANNYLQHVHHQLTINDPVTRAQSSCSAGSLTTDSVRSNQFESDRYYKFHIHERAGPDAGAEPGASSPETTPSVVDDDESFAGLKDLSNGTSTIRSNKGTVRGVKNRVRNGIATFLQMQQTGLKNYKDKEAGKVVVYSTSMGIVRETYTKCMNVKQILRTLLVKFEEKDIFMSNEYQQEIKERMQADTINIPQVFVDGQHIGDAECIERLNESGELRKMLKPYKCLESPYMCKVCGGYRLLPCPSCGGSKKSIHRNHFTAEFVALKCMNCDEVGLVKCHNC